MGVAWGVLLFGFLEEAWRAFAPENSGASPERANTCELFAIFAHMRRPVNSIFRAQTKHSQEGVGNHLSSHPGHTVPYLCSVVGNCLRRLNSSILYSLPACKDGGPGASSSSPGRVLAGKHTFFLFLHLPEPPPLRSQVLSGVPRPVLQLSHPVSGGDLSVSIPFLSFIGNGDAAIAV